MIRVAVFNRHPAYRLAHKPIAAYVRRVLREAGVGRASVSVVLNDAPSCRKMNRTYLGHDSVTDVISFRLEEGKELEGEIYVNLDRTRRQAREYGIPFNNELARLVIHGVLHLVGYDDCTAVQRRKMKAREDTLLRLWFQTSGRA